MNNDVIRRLNISSVIIAYSLLMLLVSTRRPLTISELLLYALVPWAFYHYYRFANRASVTLIEKLEIVYCLCGLLLAGICIVGGIVLLLRGAGGGSVHLLVQVKSAKVEVSKAGAGVILFVVGFLIVLTTRYHDVRKSSLIYLAAKRTTNPDEHDF